MISKVEQYEKIYSEFMILHNKLCAEKKSKEEFKDRIRSLKEKEAKANYWNANVVVEYMTRLAEQEKKKKETALVAEVANEVCRLSNPSVKVKKNIWEILNWIPREKIVNKASKSLNISKEINVVQAERLGLLGVFLVINKIFSYVFRGDFLKFFPKVLRIISAYIFWNLFSFIFQVSAIIILGYAIILDLSEVFYIILVLNIIIYFFTRYLVGQYVIKNSSVCFAVFNPKEFEKILYEKRYNLLLAPVFNNWNSEIEAVKSEGVDNVFSKNPNSLYNAIKAELQKICSDCNNSIVSYNEKIEKVAKRVNELNNQINDKKNELKTQQDSVNNFIKQDNNNGVLSEYVSVGFTSSGIEDVEKIISIKHKYNPVVIYYDDDIANNFDLFKVKTECLINKLKEGFYRENCYGIFELHLIDFEGLHFPKEISGQMEVLRKKAELEAYYSKLEKKREQLFYEGNGRINDLNPIRIRKGDNPFLYNIAFFVGVDFHSIDQEIVQLYSNAQNIGFIPFIFIRQSDGKNLLMQEIKGFTKILKNINDSQSVYSLRDLTNNLKDSL